jgi:hypothetical protein
VPAAGVKASLFWWRLLLLLLPLPTRCCCARCRFDAVLLPSSHMQSTSPPERSHIQKHTKHSSLYKHTNTHTFQKQRNRVLVTGGAGFVGSHLCEYLVNRGDQVICLDNFFTGSKDNVAHLIGRPNFEVIRHDVVEPVLLEVDQIYHLACPASPIHYKCVDVFSGGGGGG